VALAAIELQEVSIRFGKKSNALTILENVNMSVAEGESIVVIGPSGEGKSVLLKIMAGLIRPTSGRVLIRGNDLFAVSGARRQELLHKMGMLFQKNALFNSLTCGENIAFPLREVTDSSEEEIQKVVDQFLDAVGIAHAKALFPDELSGGMQKRLGIARALALHPEIVFFDDPTAGLDPITSRKIMELILTLKKTNKSTSVTITNDMNRAFQLADRICLLAEKTLIDAGTTEALRAHADPRVKNFISGNLAVSS
jgi:phospholipid/cholesterol/gamma-HCH transport system ATP-binding protein